MPEKSKAKHDKSKAAPEKQEKPIPVPEKPLPEPVNSTVTIGNTTLDLIFDKEGNRYVKHKGAEYRILLDLLKACPELVSNEDDIIPLSKAVLHLLFGNKVKLIENSEEYIAKYWKTVVEVAADPTILPPRIATMWLVPLEVHKILSPRILGDSLICYVEDARSGLPFVFSLKVPVDTPMPDFTLKALSQFTGFFTGEF